METKLLEIAGKAAGNAYAPYSKFKVGAAVLLEDGAIITGNNQENGAFPSGMCAERVALNYAKSQYPSVAIKAIAITSISTSEMVTPCGSCRQVMAEIVMRQGVDFSVVMQNSQEIMTKTVSELLPMAFKF